MLFFFILMILFVFFGVFIVVVYYDVIIGGNFSLSIGGFFFFNMVLELGYEVVFLVFFEGYVNIVSFCGVECGEDDGVLIDVGEKMSGDWKKMGDFGVIIINLFMVSLFFLIEFLNVYKEKMEKEK